MDESDDGAHDVHPDLVPPLLDVREPQEIQLLKEKAPNGDSVHFISIN